jgi:hypothetical protein
MSVPVSAHYFFHDLASHAHKPGVFSALIMSGRFWAKMSAVLPSSFFAFTSAPAAMRALTLSAPSFSAAFMSAVLPLLLFAFTFAPAAINALTLSKLPVAQIRATM